jgi:C4-dicarboxylate-specific signal transduction histidine kinase
VGFSYNKGVTEPLESLAARGALAGGVAAELAAPLGRIQRILAETVKMLDRHVASARGPEPLAWEHVGRVREQIAEAYLEVGRAARLAADLAAITAPSSETAEVDVNEVVERAAALARHRVAGDGEILLDLGTLPRIRADAGLLVQTIAHVLLIAADETTGAALVVTTAEDAGGGVRIVVKHPSPGGDHAPMEPPFWHLVRQSVTAAGGTVAEARLSGEVVVDIRLPAAPPR